MGRMYAVLVQEILECNVVGRIAVRTTMRGGVEQGFARSVGWQPDFLNRYHTAYCNA